MEENRLVMEGRKTLVITGVKDVSAFSEDQAEVETALGKLLIAGRALHLDLLDLDKGEARLSGSFDSLWYPDDAGVKKGFFGRLFSR